MNIIVLNTNFDAVGVIDVFKSFIWTDRYNSFGDFEWYTPMSDPQIALVEVGFYLQCEMSAHTMIIEHIEIETSIEDGDFMKIKGRSLESILDRRIVWKQTNLSGNLQNGIKKLLDDSIISPSIEERKIENFIFVSNNDERITSLILEAQFTGDTVYNAITSICESVDNMGWMIRLTEDKKMLFYLYYGTDRTDELTNKMVVRFTPDLDNLIESDYIYSISDYKNVALIAGEGDGSNRKTVTIGSSSGINRRELFVDARDISSTSEGGTISAATYNKLLQSRGYEKLAENSIAKIFDGEIECTRLFKYGEDFYLGDIVELLNEYGNSAKVRIDEFIISIDDEGEKSYPTFTVIE